MFTTLRVIEGEALFWPDHVVRLEEGSARLGLAAPTGLDARVAAAVGELRDARVRITLRRDRIDVEACPYEPPVEPWRLLAVPSSPEEDGPLVKTTARERYDAARKSASAYDDAILESSGGGFLECTIANVFVVVDGCLKTPPASLPLLPGIARGRVLRAARAFSAGVSEAPVGRRELQEAQECFVTNALFATHPVAVVEGVASFEPGKLARQLRDVLVRPDPRNRIIR